MANKKEGPLEKLLAKRSKKRASGEAARKKIEGIATAVKSKKTIGDIPEIVKRAMVDTVTDIGQLTAKDIRELDKYVKMGVLVKGKGNIFPIPKTVWAIKGYDIAKAREEGVKKLLEDSERMDKLKEEERKKSKEPKRLAGDNYLTLYELPNGDLKIELTEEGKEKAKEDDITYDNFWDYFEGIQVNSGFVYHPNLGEAGLGMTDAPGITEGYEMNEEGNYTDNILDDEGKEIGGANEDSKLWYFNDYAIINENEKLKEDGFVVFTRFHEHREGGTVDSEHLRLVHTKLADGTHSPSLQLMSGSHSYLSIPAGKNVKDHIEEKIAFIKKEKEEGRESEHAARYERMLHVLGRALTAYDAGELEPADEYARGGGLSDEKKRINNKEWIKVQWPYNHNIKIDTYAKIVSGYRVYLHPSFVLVKEIDDNTQIWEQGDGFDYTVASQFSGGCPDTVKTIDEAKKWIEDVGSKKFEKGGTAKEDFWIKDAIHHPGALRRKAARQHLIKKDGKLTKKALHVLEGEDKKTSEQAHLAETLIDMNSKRKYEFGGPVKAGKQLYRVKYKDSYVKDKWSGDYDMYYERSEAIKAAREYDGRIERAQPEYAMTAEGWYDKPFMYFASKEDAKGYNKNIGFKVTIHKIEYDKKEHGGSVFPGTPIEGGDGIKQPVFHTGGAVAQTDIHSVNIEDGTPDPTFEKGGKMKPMPEEGTPEWHKVRIARQTMKMTDAGAMIMGGPTKEEARKTLDEYGIKYEEGGTVAPQMMPKPTFEKGGDMKKEKAHRGYYRLSKGRFEKTANGRVEVYFGMYYKSGGADGEMKVEWEMLNDAFVPRLCAFDDAWKLLPGFHDVIAEMAKVNDKNITEPEFVQLLEKCGFLDFTDFAEGGPVAPQMMPKPMFAKGGSTEKFDLSKAPPKIPNVEAHAYSENLLPFIGNNIDGKHLPNGDYGVFGYGYYPLWFWCKKDGKWYGNSTKASATTSKQFSQSRPSWDAQMLSHEELSKKMLGESEASFELGGITVRNLAPITLDNTLVAHSGSNEMVTGPGQEPFNV